MKGVEGTCSLCAAALHISSWDMRASAATAPCQSQRALEKSFSPGALVFSGPKEVEF